MTPPPTTRPLRVLSIVGARPQFVKAAMVGRALAACGVDETLVHTGQHYDDSMSAVFFSELGMPEPHRNLSVGSGSHAEQTGAAMVGLEALCEELVPDWAVIYGDTNGTLAGALAAAKLGIPVAHVEAGLRSFDRTMPEEINRIAADRLSSLLFCPTPAAVEHLAREGVVDGVHCVGDVMYDATRHYATVARRRSDILDRLGLADGDYVLLTIHRDFNADDPVRLAGIVDGMVASGRRIVFPVHPRTRRRLEEFGLLDRLQGSATVRALDPVGYLDMARLEAGAAGIVTDSGGVQKEAFFLSIPCLTVRTSTEWMETMASGWNQLVDTAPDILAAAVADLAAPPEPPPPVFGDGSAATAIANILAKA